MSGKQAKAPWTPATLALLGKMPDGDLAQLVGCTPQAVSLKRNKLQIPRFISTRHKIHWGEAEIGLLHSYTDKQIAKMTGRTLADIKAKRAATLK